MLLDMHKKYAQQHEPYLQTSNKRPGPSLLDSSPQKDELIARRNFSWTKSNFDLTSSRLCLDLIDWKKVLSVHCAKSGTSGVFFASQTSGAFVIKACADVVSCLFATKVFMKL